MYIYVSKIHITSNILKKLQQLVLIHIEITNTKCFGTFFNLEPTL